MDRMTLREAAERSARSITTLRRYIRSGRLRADKVPGRFGPEYLVTEPDLAEAGFTTGATDASSLPVPARGPTSYLGPRSTGAAVPSFLYQELQMKHEQLLVQYGMVRAAGLRTVEIQAELEQRRRQVEEREEEIARLRERFAREIDLLTQRLHEATLDAEGRAIEVAALREKVRALEMLTRNAVTSETIERQFSAVMEQSRLVERLAGGSPPAPSSPTRAADPDH